ncbi:MAG: RnfABCDGE type electron transport complex subunit D, partial [Oscillospiraceae bacterium]|nr:RnfABCDGE type electron transport complex subunit D [Oscillospiraceae bacterium]
MKGLFVSPSPHRSSNASTARIMLMVIISLVPAAVAGCVFFGPRTALVLAMCIACCIIFEALCRIVMKREQTVGDLSAVVTGLLLGMNLPATVPFYIPIIGSFVAIVVVKQLFGGIGQNFANPAIAARIVLMLSFTGQMSNWVKPYWYTSVVDAESSATPLVSEWLTYSANGSSFKMAPFTLAEMFFGETGGCIGETCAAAVIVGGLFIFFARIISPPTP